VPVVVRNECPSWRWIERQRDPFVEQLDGVGVTELVRREPSALSSGGRDSAPLDPDGAGRPRAAAGRPVDHAEQRPDRKLGPVMGPRLERRPRPGVHSDRAPLIVLAVPDEDGPATRVEVRLGQRESVRDPKPGTPEHDNQSAQPSTVPSVSGLAHHGDDLVHGGRIGRVTLAFVPRGLSGAMAWHPSPATVGGPPHRATAEQMTWLPPNESESLTAQPYRLDQRCRKPVKQQCAPWRVDRAGPAPRAAVSSTLSRTSAS